MTPLLGRLLTPRVILELGQGLSGGNRDERRAWLRATRLDHWGVAAAMGLLAAATFAIGTASPGPGLDPDAQSYLGAATSLAHSGAYRVPTSSWTVADSSEPLTHFPPGFSTIIAVPIRLGVSPVQAGRLVVVLAALMTWAGLVALVADAAGRRAGLLVGLAALCTPAIVTVHLSILSEPLFLTTLVAVLAGMCAMSASSKAWSVLATGVAVAWAVLFRYAGLSLGMAALVWCVLGPSGKGLGWPARLRRAGLLLAPVAVTLGPWLVRSKRVGGPDSVRRIGIYGHLGATVRAGLDTIMAWMVPLGSGPQRLLLVWLALVGVGAMAGSTWQRVSRSSGRIDEPATPPITADRRAGTLLWVVGTAAGAYGAFLVASRLLADPDIPFDERILAPLLLLAQIGLALVVAAWWPGRRWFGRLAVAGSLLIWLTASAVVSVQRITFAREDGNDFAGSDWRDSPTMAWVRSSGGGEHRVLYSNWPAALYFQAHRPAHDLPSTLDRLALHRFRERLAQSHGVVVAFTTPSPDVASPDSIAQLVGLRLIAHFDDGSVWEGR